MYTGFKVCENASNADSSKNRIGSLLPALAGTVMEQWSDTKDVVRVEALDCALVISRYLHLLNSICFFEPVKAHYGEPALYRYLSLNISWKSVAPIWVMRMCKSQYAAVEIVVRQTSRN